MWAVVRTAILAWLARWVGQRQGRAAQKAVDQAVVEQAVAVQKQAEIEHEVETAAMDVPAGRDATVERLRSGEF